MLLSSSSTCVKMLTLLMVVGLTMAWNLSRAARVTDSNLASHLTIYWLQLCETVVHGKASNG